MKEATLKMIHLTLESDDSVAEADRKAILAVCKNPLTATYPSNSANQSPERWLSRKQAAARLSVSLRTVQRLVKSGALPSRMVLGCRRIPESALAPGGQEDATRWTSLEPTAPGKFGSGSIMRAN